MELASRRKLKQETRQHIYHLPQSFSLSNKLIQGANVDLFEGRN